MNQNNAEKTKDAIDAMMKVIPAKLMVIAAAIMLILVFFRPWVQVGAGQRGIVLNFGAVQSLVMEEGLHVFIPVMQKVALMDVRGQKS